MGFNRIINRSFRLFICSYLSTNRWGLCCWNPPWSFSLFVNGFFSNIWFKRGCRRVLLEFPKNLIFSCGQNSSSSSGGNGNGSSSSTKEEETPWLVEIKNILFYFGRNEIHGKSEAVKNSSTKNHVWYKIAYNCTYTALRAFQLSTSTLTVCLVRVIVLLILTYRTEKNHSNTSYIGNFEK